MLYSCFFINTILLKLLLFIVFLLHIALDYVDLELWFYLFNAARIFFNFIFAAINNKTIYETLLPL